MHTINNNSNINNNGRLGKRGLYTYGYTRVRRVYVHTYIRIHASVHG